MKQQQTFDEAVDRAFGRVEKVLDAVEANGTIPSMDRFEEANQEMESAQPWDLANIGQALVQDSIEAERDEDDRIFK